MIAGVNNGVTGLGEHEPSGSWEKQGMLVILNNMRTSKKAGVELFFTGIVVLGYYINEKWLFLLAFYNKIPVEQTLKNCADIDIPAKGKFVLPLWGIDKVFSKDYLVLFYLFILTLNFKP
jgi:hypothetical protein